MRIEPQKIGAPTDLKNIPRERWATVLGMIFVQKMPLMALISIVLEGERLFIKRGLQSDTVGMKREDYSDIFKYITMSVQQYHRTKVEMEHALEAAQRDYKATLKN